jgi:hypothetical protein
MSWLFLKGNEHSYGNLQIAFNVLSTLVTQSARSHAPLISFEKGLIG